MALIYWLGWWTILVGPVLLVLGAIAMLYLAFWITEVYSRAFDKRLERDVRHQFRDSP